MSHRSQTLKTGSTKQALASPELSIKYISTNELRLNSANPRQHPDEQIQRIANSIDTFGFCVPIGIDENSMVIFGHGRLLAARRLNLPRVPVVSLSHLTKDQLRALMIADNRLTEASTWDRDLLAEQLKFLAEAELDFSLEVTGFEMGEIDVIIEGADPAGDLQNDPADSLPDSRSAIPVSREGDLWSLSKHRIYCGNSLDHNSFLTLMTGRRADMVFIDPPYNVKISGHAGGLGTIQHPNFKMASGEMNDPQFTDFLSQAVTLLADHSAEGSLQYIFMDWRGLQPLLNATKHAYSELKNVCVWSKGSGGMGSLYRSAHELVFVFKFGKDKHINNVQLGQYGRYRTNVWNYPGMNSFARKTEEGNLLELHPTVKPVALVADAIMDVSSRGDLVLDSFLGSGTTLIAAERTGRTCYGIELEPVYVDVAVRRWQTLTGLQAKHFVSGRTFSELEQEAANARKQ
jgi:DNA modification methylase